MPRLRIGAGELADRVAFYRLVDDQTEYGGSIGYDSTPYLECWCQFRPQIARERSEAGRLEAAVAGIIRVRHSVEVMAVTAADKAVIDGVDYQVRSDPITSAGDPFVEFNVERGVGV